MILKRWLEETILELNLCPFAHTPYQNGRIRLEEAAASSPLEAQRVFLDELETLFESDNLSTTLIGFPHWKIDFEEFLDFFYAMEDITQEAGLRDSFQLVAFHPGFKLEGFPEDSFAHWPGRSPMPVLHLLRREEVTAASSGLTGEKISERNEEVIQALGPEKRRKHFFWMS